MWLLSFLVALQLFCSGSVIAEESSESDENFQVEGIQQVNILHDYGFNFVNIGREINRDTLAQVHLLLKRIHSSAEHLQGRSDEVRSKWDIEIENTENNAHEIWQSWIDNELSARNISGNVSEIFESYVSNATHRIHGCADIIRANLQVYDEKVNELRNRYSKIAAFLASQVQACIVNSNIDCQRKVAVEYRKLQYGPREFSSLTAEGSGLLLSDLEYHTCVAFVQYEFENGKNRIRQAANQLFVMDYND